MNLELPGGGDRGSGVLRFSLPHARPQTPASAGAFRPIELVLPTPSLLAAEAPAAVAAGNVETSMRVVDVVLRALAQALPERTPAASQGTMNNLALGAGGDDPWDYYETLAGGHGAPSSGLRGLCAAQPHDQYPEYPD